MRFLRGALIFLGIATAAVTQDPAAKPTDADSVIRVNVRQVLVPVVVTDKKGHSVGGLTPSDFQIAEDGVAQEIVAFTREVAPRAGGTSASLGPASSAPKDVAGPPITTAAPKH